MPALPLKTPTGGTERFAQFNFGRAREWPADIVEAREAHHLREEETGISKSVLGRLPQDGLPCHGFQPEPLAN